MKNRLRNAPELLDDETHDDLVLAHSLDHVAQVNRFLGGHAVVLSALEPLLVTGGVLRILDIGTGSADIPRAIVDAARGIGVDVSIVATDLHPQMRARASEQCAAYPEIRIESADALALPYADASFDVTILSLMIHHLEDASPAAAVREAARVGRFVIVNELERGWLNYAGARLLAATWWRSSPLTRHDGPLSVRRSFTVTELRAIARDAELVDVHIRRRWFGRLLMTGRADDATVSVVAS